MDLRLGRRWGHLPFIRRNNAGYGGNGDHFVLDNLTTMPITAPSTDLQSSFSGVPEPSTWALMLLGFAGLGYAGFRKAQSGRAALAAA